MSYLTEAHQGGSRKAERLEYRIYHALAFLFFLPIAIVRRMSPARAARRTNVFQDAQTAARGVVPWIFMG